MVTIELCERWPRFPAVLVQKHGRPIIADEPRDGLAQDALDARFHV
jgi:hypothetical protein